MPEKEYLKVSETAALLAISERKVRLLIEAERLPCVRIANHNLTRIKRVDALALKTENVSDGLERMNGLKVRYGLTEKQFAALLATQGGKCKICRKVATKWNVDHDHACCAGRNTCGNCIRGILCSGCNSGLGYFGDSVDVLRSAISYLINNAPRSQASDKGALTRNLPKSP